MKPEGEFDDFDADALLAISKGDELALSLALKKCLASGGALHPSVLEALANTLDYSPPGTPTKDINNMPRRLVFKKRRAGNANDQALECMLRVGARVHELRAGKWPERITDSATGRRVYHQADKDKYGRLRKHRGLTYEAAVAQVATSERITRKGRKVAPSASFVRDCYTLFKKAHLKLAAE